MVTIRKHSSSGAGQPVPPKIRASVLAITEKNIDVLNTLLIEYFTYRFFRSLKII